MKYSNIREEELKSKVAQDFFDKFDCTKIIRNLDFSVRFKEDTLFHNEYLLWAEAKKSSTDIYTMLAQLVLTIGKERPFNEHLPPKFLGCFDCGKIVFIPYSEIQDIFYRSDFNWNVAPSKHETKEFISIHGQIDRISGDKIYIFDFEKDENDLRKFIKQNFVLGQTETSKIRIDKNNFITIYGKWLETVKPTIGLSNWDKAKEMGILDGDFYLADLLSRDNMSFKDNLLIMLRQTMYLMDRYMDEIGALSFRTVEFKDEQKAHTQFWTRYERPPKEDYWDYIVKRRDLLVPQDVRERKGAFFTPQIWVELSQRYIANVLGVNWQDEYYVWDCAAGTGNLLAGLTNKYNIWASTLDKADVDVMHDRIENGANLLKDHCFQFDFLNDSFDKLPEELLDIIKNTPEKLVVYINPPYAEAAQYGRSKDGVTSTLVYEEFKHIISFAVNELSSQFLARIYKELPNCKLASFSKLKYVIASNFSKFRDYFKAEYLKGFVCHASTFDNVKGNFPISFLIWDLEHKKKITRVNCDVFDKKGKLIGKRKFFSVNKGHVINDWLRKYYDNQTIIAYLRFVGPDFQASSGVYITSKPKESDIKESRIQTITQDNLIVMSIYLAVRKVISADWLNDRDQFLYPNNRWETDIEFQNDCLTYTLFSNYNNVQSKHGTNYWIPFTETEVNSRGKFKNSFMTDFMAGKLKPKRTNGEPIKMKIFDEKKSRKTALVFSAEAQAVFEVGKKLWTYYHAQPKCNVNASFYDIREHFQGRNAKGAMNSKSEDEKYNELIGGLRSTLSVLAKKIEPKVYEYGFLKG